MSACHGRLRAVEAMAPILRRLCFVDIETTGLDASTEEIIEIGAVFVERGVVVDRKQWLIRPTKSLPALIIALTGITDSELAISRPLTAVAPELMHALEGWPLVAHNGNFERSFLKELIASNALLDSCEVAQLLFPERPSHSLDSLVRWLGVGDGARHRAIDDAEDTFLMLAALCDRFVNEGTHEQLDVLLRHLKPGLSADRAVLCTLLESLQRELRGGHSRNTPRATTQPGLAQRIAGWLDAPTVVCAELERQPVVELALEAAALATADELIAVCVPSSTFREVSQRADVPALAHRKVGTSTLQAALATTATDELEQFGRAYLSAWSLRTRTGELDGVSGFVRSRAAGVAELLKAATTSGSDDENFTTPGWVLISHEHALEWLERGVPARYLVADADRLPDAERRRLQRSLELRHLADAKLPAEELERALAAHPQGAVSMRDRAKPAWLAIREALTQLAHTLRARARDAHEQRLLDRVVDVIDPPPPGFELVVRADGLTRTPIRPAERVARRLQRGVCLLSSFLGGTAWSQVTAINLPPTARAQLETRTEPTSLVQLASVVNATNADLLVTPGPLEPVVEALLEAGVNVSLGAHRSGALRVVEWRRDPTPQSAQCCVFYGVRDWRRAVLSVEATRVVLASEHGLPPEPLRRALKGLTS